MTTNYQCDRDPYLLAMFEEAAKGNPNMAMQRSTNAKLARTRLFGVRRHGNRTSRKSSVAFPSTDKTPESRRNEYILVIREPSSPNAYRIPPLTRCLVGTCHSCHGIGFVLAQNTQA